MDGSHFDRLTRSLTEPHTRRGLTRFLRGVAVGGPLVLLGLAEAEAKRKKKKRKKRKKQGDGQRGAVPIPGITSPPPPSCTPTCAGKVCGDDGCGGVCGVPCPSTHTCQDGRCICSPECAGKACGPDGCGGLCGSCSGGSCQGGVCTCGTGKELCQGECLDECGEGANVAMRRPDTCECCCKNGFMCDELGTPCCSGNRDLGGNCATLDTGANCSFDAQCESGKCEWIDAGGGFQVQKCVA